MLSYVAVMYDMHRTMQTAGRRMRMAREESAAGPPHTLMSLLCAKEYMRAVLSVRGVDHTLMRVTPS
jgi:hypothetical protein